MTFRLRPFDTIEDYDRFMATHFVGACEPGCEHCAVDAEWMADQERMRAEWTALDAAPSLELWGRAAA